MFSKSIYYIFQPFLFCQSINQLFNLTNYLSFHSHSVFLFVILMQFQPVIVKGFQSILFKESNQFPTWNKKNDNKRFISFWEQTKFASLFIRISLKSKHVKKIYSLIVARTIDIMSLVTPITKAIWLIQIFLAFSDKIFHS